MSEFPMVDMVIAVSEELPLKTRKIDGSALATELRELLNELNSLRARASQPMRKLREYKSPTVGAIYRVYNGMIQFKGDGEWCIPAAINTDDVLGVADLLREPYEPVETIDSILIDYAQTLSAGRECRHLDFADRIRAAVLNELNTTNNDA